MTTSGAQDASTPRRRRPSKRQILVAVVIVVLLANGIVALIDGGGSSIPPPATAAAKLVPADALAYVNLSLDRSRAPVRQADRLVDGFPGWPTLESAVIDRLGAMLGATAPGDPGLRGWIGGEAAFAIVPTGGSGATVAGTLIALAVRHPQALQRFLAAGPSVSDGSDGGTPLRRFPGGTVAARVAGFLVLGQAASVRAAIAAAHGASPLAASASYQRAIAGEPPGRVLDAYVPAGGIRELVGGRGGPLGALDLIAAQPGLQAVSLTVSPAAGGAGVRILSTFSPASAGGAGGGFRPTLAAVAPAASGLLLDVRDLVRVAPSLLAAVADTGVAGGLPPLLTRLGAALRAEGADLGGVLALFTREVAIDLVDAGGRPAVLVLSRTARPAHARTVLAEATTPLESLFSSNSVGSEPLFQTRTVAGVAVHGLALGTGLQIDYAVDRDLILIGTSEDAVAAALGRSPRLGSRPIYRSAFRGAPTGVSSLLFADLTVLVGLGEQTDLLHGTLFHALEPALERISAIGLHASHADHDTTAELFLRIP